MTDSLLMTCEQWRKRSAVLQSRSADALLGVVDHLLADYHRGELREFRPEITARLYLTCTWWLKLLTKREEKFDFAARRIFSGDAGRKNAFEQLRQQATDVLMTQYRLSHAPGQPSREEMLEAELQELVGKPMDPSHAAVRLEIEAAKNRDMTVLQSSRVLYFNDRERRLSKLRFRDGLAYKRDDATWRQPQTKWPRKRVDEGETSMRLYDTLWEVNEDEVGSAAYAMDLDGHLYTGFGYMGPWYDAHGDLKPVKLHHSTFLAGAEVVCAGMIRVVKGRVLEISNGSGHYKPPPKHLLHVLVRLAAHGVKIDRLLVHVLPENKRYYAKDFIAAGADVSWLERLDKSVTCRVMCRNCGKTVPPKSKRPAPRHPDACAHTHLVDQSRYFLPPGEKALPPMNGAIDFSGPAWIEKKSG